ncbi:hypothetical protein ABZX85_38390 [Streptomyces sp. NPDC004539]|uniref:hypothetical protein n=1 Tax=Streptomyces sp. NPDC004539 TaxID=3154280 RepID=UPI00339E0064
MRKPRLSGPAMASAALLCTTAVPTLAAEPVATASCPAQGHITYTLVKAASPTADQADSYARITTAMNQALSLYNCHTNITKSLRVSYVPSVPTAEGGYDGEINFGAKSSMQKVTAMHETAHTLGVGTYRTWPNRMVNGVWNGPAATAVVRQVTGDPAATVHGDAWHFWPGGLNYESEGRTETDLINHITLVVALRKDMGITS